MSTYTGKEKYINLTITHILQYKVGKMNPNITLVNEYDKTLDFPIKFGRTLLLVLLTKRTEPLLLLLRVFNVEGSNRLRLQGS